MNVRNYIMALLCIAGFGAASMKAMSEEEIKRAEELEKRTSQIQVVGENYHFSPDQLELATIYATTALQVGAYTAHAHEYAHTNKKSLTAYSHQIFELHNFSRYGTEQETGKNVLLWLKEDRLSPMKSDGKPANLHNSWKAIFEPFNVIHANGGIRAFAAACAEKPAHPVLANKDLNNIEQEIKQLDVEKVGTEMSNSQLTLYFAYAGEASRMDITARNALQDADLKLAIGELEEAFGKERNFPKICEMIGDNKNANHNDAKKILKACKTIADHGGLALLQKSPASQNKGLGFARPMLFLGIAAATAAGIYAAYNYIKNKKPDSDALSQETAAQEME